MEQPEHKARPPHAGHIDEPQRGLPENSRIWTTSTLQQLLTPVTSLERVEKAYFEQHPRTPFQETIEKFGAGLLAIVHPTFSKIVALAWIILALWIPFSILRPVAQKHLWIMILHFGLFVLTFEHVVVAFHRRARALLTRILLCGFSRWEDLSEVMPNAVSTGIALRAKVQIDSTHSKPKLIRTEASSFLRTLVVRRSHRADDDSARSSHELTTCAAPELQATAQQHQRPVGDSNRFALHNPECSASSSWKTRSMWLRALLRVCAFGMLCSKHYVVVATVAGLATLGAIGIRVPGSTLANELGIALVVISVAIGVFTRFVAASRLHGWVLSQSIGVVGMVLLSFQQLRVLVSGIAQLTGWPSLLLVGGVGLAILWAAVRVFYLPGRILLYTIQFMLGIFLLQDLSGMVGEVASAFAGNASVGVRRLVDLKVVAGVAILAKMIEELLKDIRSLIENIEKSAQQLFEQYKTQSNEEAARD